MNILWNLFDIGVNCFQGFIMMYFPFKFLGGRFSDKFLKNHGAMFAVLYTMLISFLNKISAFEHFLALLYVALVFIYCITCLKGKLLHKIFASVFPVVIGLIISALTFSGTAVLLNQSFNDVLIAHDWKRFVSVIITQLLIYYLIILSLKIFGKNKYSSHQLSHDEWILITVTLLLTIIIGAFFVLVSFDNITDKSRLFIMLGILSILIVNTVSFYLIIDLGKKNMSIIENEKLKIQISYNKQYIENADTEFNLIQKLRHDNKAIYQVLSDFLSRGEIDKANNYLKKLEDIADNKIIFINTDNDFANSIINAKLTIAKSFGINVTCFSVDSFAGIDDIDLCRLLSNMLDNAITATSNLECTDKKISLNISDDIGTYTFLVCNTIEESVLKKNPDLKSIKRNKDMSGYGTKIIKDISEKYNGKCDFYEKNSLFCCSVIINVNI